MPREFNTDNLSPKELAKHLRQPKGEIGKEVGVQMNKGNKHICLNSYKLLNPQRGNHILEIGMGNGFFITDLLEMEAELSYVGVDFSSTMIDEAIELNSIFVNKKIVEFHQASIEKLPFEDNLFDCITTTNTLYFWPYPNENVKELLRVLKPGGKLLIGYRSKNCMDQLELANYNFEKYETDDVESLLSKGGFVNIETQEIEEPELEFDGKAFSMKGFYTIGFK